MENNVEKIKPKGRRKIIQMILFDDLDKFYGPIERYITK